MKMNKAMAMTTIIIAVLLVAVLALAFFAFYKAPSAGITNTQQASDSISNIGSSIEGITSILSSIDSSLGG